MVQIEHSWPYFLFKKAKTILIMLRSITNMKTNVYFRISIFTLSVFSSLAIAQTAPSTDQIQQFKMLPKSQQQALAKQYGLPLDQLPQLNSRNAEEYETPAIVAPRTVNKIDKSNNKKSNDQEIKSFGYSLFSGTPSTFSPLSDVPVPADYMLGPGDTINVELFGKESGNYNLRINRSGMINFPDMGPVAVAGMSFTELKNAINNRIKNKFIGVKADISLGELRAIRVFVLGEAWQPGPYNVSALSSITQLLYFSGGINENGSLRNIQLKRRGKVIGRLDLYDLLIKGDTSKDLRLQSGDVVFIPTVGNTVAIEGEIRRPAIYEMKNGEQLKDLITYAGGVLPTAYTTMINIEGFDNAKNRVVSTQNFTTTSGKKYKLQNGQKVVVPQVAKHFDSYVKLIGDVVRPGSYQWRQGMKVNDLLKSIQGDLTLTTDLKYALIVREKNRQRDIDVLQFQPSNAILQSDSSDNLELHARDKIILLNRYNFSELMELDSLRDSNEDLLSYKQAKHKQNKDDIKGEQSEHLIDSQELSQLQQMDQDNSVPEEYKIFTQDEWRIINEVSLISGFEVDELRHIKATSRSSLLASVLVQLKAQGSYDITNGFIEVVGEVKHPGFYPLSDKRDVNALLQAAGGLTGAAFTLAAELSRVTYISGEDAATHIVRVDLSGANSQLLESNESKKVTLMPKDRLNIFSIPNFKKNRKIVLQGEVRFPGSYSLRRGESLNDLIVRAGGLTKYGYAKGAVFTRIALQVKEQELLDSYSAGLRQEIAKSNFRVDRVNTPSANPEQSMAFIEEMTKTKAIGRMVINLDGILAGIKGDDFLLEGGDFLYVPPFRDSITIMGEVQYSTSYIFDDSLSLNDYLSKVGGPKKQADEDRIYVVRADGSVDTPGTGYWFGNDLVELKPGDTIVVPVDTDYRDLLSTWTSATQMLYQIGIAVNAIK